MFLPTRKLPKIEKITKVKMCQYNSTYLTFGFTTVPHDATRPTCLVCGSVFSNEAMKPSHHKAPQQKSKTSYNLISSDRLAS